MGFNRWIEKRKNKIIIGGGEVYSFDDRLTLEPEYTYFDIKRELKQAFLLGVDMGRKLKNNQRFPKVK